MNLVGYYVGRETGYSHRDHKLYKFQADLNVNIADDSGAFYAVSGQFESSQNMTITCSTKVCSFGKQVVEKVEVINQQ